MAGPYPPNHVGQGTGPGVGSAGPVQPPHPGAHHAHPAHHAHQAHPGGPGTGPMMAYPGLGGPGAPPVSYPAKSRRGRVFGVAAIVAVAVALAALLGYAVLGAVRDGSAAAVGGRAITEAPAEAAIQDYLNALADRNVDTITRNTLCGIYDRVTDHRSDDAVAKMSSDAFRRQFSRAEVTSIDKIVYLSNVQAQVLFTMRVTSPRGGKTRDDVQGLAQLLSVDHRILVCSYVLRTAGAY